MNAIRNRLSPPVDKASPAPSIDSTANEKEKPSAKNGKRQLIAIVSVLVGVSALVFGGRWFAESLRFVSTDDAYVNSYVTFVAPRVAGQVSEVLVEDNNRVKKGDVLVRLDPEPFQIAVDIRKSALAVAQANLALARANTQAQIGQTRGDRFKLVNSIETVDDQIAEIRQRVAALQRAEATLALGQEEYRRAQTLSAQKVISDEEMDQKREALGVAQAAVNEALEDVYQARVALGLPAQPTEGQQLSDVPPSLDQNFSTVRESLAELQQSAAQLGISFSSFNLTPQQAIQEFYQRDPGGDIDRIYAGVMENAPAIRQAEAAVKQAQNALDQAELDLRYCTIVADIDGVVTRRNVNPGDYLQVGQSLMAIRSLKEIWVDANFKETQLRDLRIGQQVTLHVDMYGSSHLFKGRISGFTMGTGSTLALLPAENATGNFVKVVQRLPVRIDLVDYDPDRTPLFVGTSVEPDVDIKSTPTGPSAGQFLQHLMALPTATP